MEKDIENLARGEVQPEVGPSVLGERAFLGERGEVKLEMGLLWGAFLVERGEVKSVKWGYSVCGGVPLVEGEVRSVKWGYSVLEGLPVGCHSCWSV